MRVADACGVGASAGETNPTKHELQGGREIMGTFRQFTYKELHALGAVLDVAFEGDMTVESKDSMCASAPLRACASACLRLRATAPLRH